VDLLGTTYQSPTIATGFGAYIAQPLLRNAVDESAELLTEDEAVAVIQKCMKALFYRDARSLNKVSDFSALVFHLITSPRNLTPPIVSSRQGHRRGRHYI
jgi:20S proteasome alpha/beta subunit